MERVQEKGLENELWRNNEEHIATQQDALAELYAHRKQRLIEGQELNMREAATELYQPTSDLEELDSDAQNSTPPTVTYPSESANDCTVVSGITFFQPPVNIQASTQSPTMSSLLRIGSST
jgi:hypothetical protein